MSGANYIHDAAGLMDGDLTVSYDKLVIDNEILGMCQRVLKGIEVSDETLAIDLIEKVGPGGNFLSEMHTVEHMRGEFFENSLADRTLYTQWKSDGKKDIVKRAREKLQEIINSHVS